jgi:hypothetical protein
MGGSNQNENLILIEDENETNKNEMKIEKYVKRIKNGNVQTKNSKVEKNMELIMIFFCRIYMFKEKFIEAMTEMFYVFTSRR